ncbi:MAG: hypothetical protein BJ554DRAFT_5843 [Olpidium bornovanus]|uniref:K Homology domain-containing protein n=1 Tax=Olpidium bornovanus TaxID=278681 RepID=A0A8H8A1W7_9FUNG|nr:MAG: hypothetical protein BJ554DRAFT_5843 [Olpidium bornovanus]
MRSHPSSALVNRRARVRFFSPSLPLPQRWPSKAFGLLAQKVVDETSTPESRIDSTSVRILAPHNVIGPLIGKGGGKIKEMQEASGACIMASEAVVPDSMEQTVTVSGAPEAIQSALYQIGRILQEQPSVPTVPYRPSASRPPALPAYPPIPPPAGLQQAPGHHQPQAQPVYADPYATVGPYGYPVQPSVPHAAGPFHHLGHPPAPGSVVHHPRAAAASPQAAAAAPAGTQAQQIFVPNEMVGCIIGKGGARINEIRQLSGCTIKIAEPNAWASERLVTITGTPEANQMALYLLYSRIELEKSRAPAGY